jgi:hypothetical protein
MKRDVVPRKKPVDQPAQPACSALVYSGNPHCNQRLFSNHFLNTLLPAEARWKKHWEALKDEAQTLKEELRACFQAFAPAATTSKAHTEAAWIRPVLTLLGHTFEVQTEIRTPGRTPAPGYVFYRSAETCKTHHGRIPDDSAQQQDAIAVGDASCWLRPLDMSCKGSPISSATDTQIHPALKLFLSMQRTACPWGILTNGKHWRLYHQHTAHKLEVYYEIDLPDLLLAANVESFLYFYAFFRRAAFDPGPLSLERLLEASVAYTERVSDDLRQQAHAALCDIAQGFLEYAPNALAPTAKNLHLLYGSSLVLLYRFLFILYAQARGLLSLTESPIYRQQCSLEACKRRVAQEGQEDSLVATSGNTWQHFKMLFTALAGGSTDLHTTAFPGGLFAADTSEFHHFLDTAIPEDPWICRALDRLTRAHGHIIDYRDLAERHLGTIHEGLLAYTLQVANEPIDKVQSPRKIVPQARVSGPACDIARKYQQHQVYLVTDRGDRKASGSYYTPDYIVAYMVEQAVGATLNDALAQMDKASDTEKIQKILSLRILDPAMGSGHFLVEVVEFIARFLVGLDVQSEEITEATLTYWKRCVVEQCVYGVDVNPLSVELAKLSLWLATAAKNHPLHVLDHHLRVGNALVGCWFDEILGEHRRTSKNNGKQPQQTRYRGEEIAVQAEVEPLLDSNVLRADIIRAITTLQEARERTCEAGEARDQQRNAAKSIQRDFQETYTPLANLKAALSYMDVSADLWRPLAHALLGKKVSGGPAVSKKLAEITEEALQIAQERKRCFHWELAFPSLFYDIQGRPLGAHAGFDVIVGNPPYVRQEQLWEDKPFFAEHFDIFQSTADLFVYFFRQGLHLLRHNGRLIYISSGTWLRASYATALRHYLRTHTCIEHIIDLGNTRIFADAPDLSPAIQMVRKHPPTADQQSWAAIFTRTDTITEFRANLAARLFPISIADQPDEGWQLKSNASRQLFARLLTLGRPLHTVVDGQIYRGLLTGLNEAFLVGRETYDRFVQADPSCAPLLKAVVRGEDLRPWYQENEGRWLICLPAGWTIATFPELRSAEALAWECLAQRYPGLAAYLTSIEEEGRTRLDQGQFWWEWGADAHPETNLSPMFFLDEVARQRIVGENDAALPIQAYRQGVSSEPDANARQWLLVLPTGWTRTTFPGVASREALAWKKFAARHPALAAHLEPFANAGRRRQDQGQFWWELRACDYYSSFEQEKICYPDIAQQPRFSWDESGTYTTNTAYIIVTQALDVAGLLNSRVMWFMLTFRAQPLAERKGALIYRLFTQYIERLPIPTLLNEQQRSLAGIVLQLSRLASRRYDLHRKMVQRIKNDLGTGQKKVSGKLEAWWKLSWQDFRDEIYKSFNTEIPFKVHKIWENAIQEAREEIEALTRELITLEGQLNHEVYTVFGLSQEDIAVIEQASGYHAGAW